MAKKITRVEGGEATSASTVKETRTFVPTEESKSKATTFRIIAIVSWVVAIGTEIFAILKLRDVPVNTTLLIILIVVALIFAVIGSLLWKKANRLDPASEKDKVKFFIQNQLGLIISIIAFLPLVILIFTNKDLSGKQKGLVGSIAVIALLIAGVTGIDFNPPSQEQYLEQTQEVESLNNGVNLVNWTKSGHSYHLYQDCSYINSDRTDEIFQGTVAQARELKNITDLCDRCGNRAKKEKGLDLE
jgi:Na+/proline symporter